MEEDKKLEGGEKIKESTKVEKGIEMEEGMKIEEGKSEEFKAYPRRWAVMVTVMSLNMVGYMLFVSFGPVAPQAAEYYEVSGDMIDLFPLVGMAINMVGLFLAIYCIDRFGIKIALRYGSACVTLGAALRCLSTFPSYEQKMEPSTKFWLTFTGQAIIAMGHPVIITMSTKVSQVWFPEKERILSTAAMAGAPSLGGMLGSVLASVIVAKDPSNIPLLNTIFPSLALVGFLLSWLVVNSASPPSPPSSTARTLMDKEPLTVRKCFINMRAVLASPTVRWFILLMGSGVGFFNMINTQLGQFFCSVGYGPSAASLGAATLILTGLVGSFIVGPLARRWGKQVEASKACYAMTGISLIGLSVTLRMPGLFPLVMALLVVHGFFGIGGFPLALELAVEESFPNDPVISESFIHAMGQLSAIVLILLGNVMSWPPTKAMLDVQVCKTEDQGEGAVEPLDYAPYFYMIMVLCSLGSVCFTFFINPTLRRRKIDVKQNS